MNEDQDVSLDTAVRLAAGILSGSGSTQDTGKVAALAVKHAYALHAEFKRAALEAKQRILDESNRAAVEKKRADEAYAKAKKASEEKVALELKKLEEEKKIRDEQIAREDAARKEIEAKKGPVVGQVSRGRQAGEFTIA
jgi:hypothetical protein